MDSDGHHIFYEMVVMKGQRILSLELRRGMSHPGPSPSWENGANVIWLTPLPVPGSGAEGLSHGQSWLHLVAGQLGGRGQCFHFAVLAWRRVEAGLGQFLAEHYDLRRSVDPQADAAVGGLHNGDPNGLTDEDAFADFSRKD